MKKLALCFAVLSIVLASCASPASEPEVVAPIVSPIEGRWNGWTNPPNEGGRKNNITFTFTGSNYSCRFPPQGGDTGVFIGDFSFSDTTITFTAYGSYNPPTWTQNCTLNGDVLIIETDAWVHFSGYYIKEAILPSLQGTWSYSWGQNYRTLTFDGSNFSYSYSFPEDYGGTGIITGTFSSTATIITFTVGTEKWTQNYDLYGDQLWIEPVDGSAIGGWISRQ